MCFYYLKLLQLHIISFIKFKPYFRKFMVVRIFKSSKTAMQSGTGNADQWFLEFENTDQKPIDPVMSWVGSNDTSSQIKLKFATKEEATQYAKKNNLLFFIDEGTEKKMNIRKNGYGDNFDYNRKRPWTH